MRRRRHEGQRSARGYLESPKRPGHPERHPAWVLGLINARIPGDLHGLIFETSICYWQDQPGSPPSGAGQARRAARPPARLRALGQCRGLPRGPPGRRIPAEGRSIVFAGGIVRTRGRCVGPGAPRAWGAPLLAATQRTHRGHGGRPASRRNRPPEHRQRGRPAGALRWRATDANRSGREPQFGGDNRATGGRSELHSGRATIPGHARGSALEACVSENWVSEIVRKLFCKPGVREGAQEKGDYHFFPSERWYAPLLPCAHTWSGGTGRRKIVLLPSESDGMLPFSLCSHLVSGEAQEREATWARRKKAISFLMPHIVSGEAQGRRGNFLLPSAMVLPSPVLTLSLWRGTGKEHTKLSEGKISLCSHLVSGESTGEKGSILTLGREEGKISPSPLCSHFVSGESTGEKGRFSTFSLLRDSMLPFSPCSHFVSGESTGEKGRFSTFSLLRDSMLPFSPCSHFVSGEGGTPGGGPGPRAAPRGPSRSSRPPDPTPGPQHGQLVPGPLPGAPPGAPGPQTQPRGPSTGNWTPGRSPGPLPELPAPRPNPGAPARATGLLPAPGPGL
ncbi:uncharacterized protein AKAME5_002253600 [Lates japonicus]|uniref:Uncharacterized protein n=1 Tax=Lates japonicus TaxID=270547 RepID=A0AAD3NEZ3_LATJO|nr:uncharacterized protein AKAME5_002253600 [Lates japonicus]